MSPTVFRFKSYRFYFFSREEPRRHIHISCPDGEAKFWIEPAVELADSHGLSSRRISELRGIIEERQNEIRDAWDEHFGR